MIYHVTIYKFLEKLKIEKKFKNLTTSHMLYTYIILTLMKINKLNHFK